MSNIENAFLEELRQVLERSPRGYQTHIANELGLRTATLSNMVNGRRGIDEVTRAKIAMLAGIDLETLMRREGLIPPEGSAFSPRPMEHTTAILDPHEWAFIQAYRAGGRDRALIGSFTEKLKRMPYQRKPKK
jgi:transcriptional regulator with XRE-family HTH domain